MQSTLESLSQFGVAGLMGVLWVVERFYSRRRESQLDHAHRDLVRRRDQVELLVRLVQRNTAVIERFHATQRRLHATLERWQRDRRD
ncbi:MAG: hypothetical protein AAF823_10490 [Planctomycetota bacterium]